MKRREFITLNARFAAVLASSVGLSGQPVKSRAAVVIGVDKAGNLPKLRAAASGAQSIANWLNGEHFDTKLFIDTSGPVQVNDIYRAIASKVNEGVDQLVVYFAGHGFISNYSEFWMLSDAPENPNEAVSLTETKELAKSCRISNVVFISDACRSQAESLGTARVRGSLIFPNKGGPQTSVANVDVFLATLVGDSSYEVPVSTSAPQYEGIYTASFLSAFSHPDEDMVRKIGGVSVIPNKNMKSYLAREVPRRAAAASVQLRQIPDTQVVSGDDTYIGRVTGGLNVQRSVTENLTIHDVASVELARVGVRGLAGPPIPDDKINAAKNATGYARAASTIHPPVDAAPLKQLGGIVVTGIRLKAAVSNPSATAEIILGPAGQPEATLVRWDLHGAPAASFALQFDNGSGTVVAGLRRFVANVSVSEGHVVNVTYAPAPETDFWSEYNAQRLRLNDLHASVAAAARLGVFRVDGSTRDARDRASRQLADKIRILKGIDPTLGPIRE
jgi:hypothetical protein